MNEQNHNSLCLPKKHVYLGAIFISLLLIAYFTYLILTKNTIYKNENKKWDKYNSTTTQAPDESMLPEKTDIPEEPTSEDESNFSFGYDTDPNSTVINQAYSYYPYGADETKFPIDQCVPIFCGELLSCLDKTDCNRGFVRLFVRIPTGGMENYNPDETVDKKYGFFTGVNCTGTRLVTFGPGGISRHAGVMKEQKENSLDSICMGKPKDVPMGGSGGKSNYK